MPLFTPDAERFALGRPYMLWFAPISDEPYTLVRDSSGSWFVLFNPLDSEKAAYPNAFDSGRETYVTYQQVRDWALTTKGRVRYVDDYDDQYTDVYISKNNTPYARATSSEPVWNGS